MLCICFLVTIVLLCKYHRVAQTRGAFEKAMDEEYEMSKPLARYADDEDLDKMLKERRRDGDPMLIFMKKTTAGKEKDAHTRKGILTCSAVIAC